MKHTLVFQNETDFIKNDGNFFKKGVLININKVIDITKKMWLGVGVEVTKKQHFLIFK